MSPSEALPIAIKLATLTGDPLYTSAIQYLAPFLTDPDPPIDHPQTQTVLNFIATAADAHLALFGKQLE